MTTKEQIFRTLHSNQQERDKYLDSLPNDFQNFILGNEYTESVAEERDMLFHLVFGEHAYSIEWFLYEWQPGYEVGMNGVMTKIYSIDAYIQWLKENEGFE